MFPVFQIVLQGQDNRPGKVSNVGEKSFRCEYEGCGKLYTTAHHLKVSVGGCVCECGNLCACSYASVGRYLLCNIFLWCCQLLVYFFSLVAQEFCLCSRRYMSAPTLETNRTSVTIQAVGRSLQQVVNYHGVFNDSHRAVSFNLSHLLV